MLLIQNTCDWVKLGFPVYEISPDDEEKTEMIFAIYWKFPRPGQATYLAANTQHKFNTSNDDDQLGSLVFTFTQDQYPVAHNGERKRASWTGNSFCCCKESPVSASTDFMSSLSSWTFCCERLANTCLKLKKFSYGFS